MRHFKSCAEISASHDVLAEREVDHPNISVMTCYEPSGRILDKTSAEGFFLQVDIQDLNEISIHLDHACQTMSYVGDLKASILSVIAETGMAGIDRIVPVGSSGHFSFIWEGKDLIRLMSRSFT